MNGGKLAEACERFGIAYQSAKDAAWVATTFPERSDRSDLLEWTHHRVAAGHDLTARNTLIFVGETIAKKTCCDV